MQCPSPNTFNYDFGRTSQAKSWFWAATSATRHFPFAQFVLTSRAIRYFSMGFPDPYSWHFLRAFLRHLRAFWGPSWVHSGPSWGVVFLKILLGTAAIRLARGPEPLDFLLKCYQKLPRFWCGRPGAHWISYSSPIGNSHDPAPAGPGPRIIVFRFEFLLETATMRLRSARGPESLDCLLKSYCKQPRSGSSRLGAQNQSIS